MNMEIQDKASLLDSKDELMKKYKFWNKIANGLIQIDKECPPYDVDDCLFNKIKEVVGVRNIELVKIMKSKGYA
jgi:hypothetical protein